MLFCLPSLSIWSIGAWAVPKLVCTTEVFSHEINKVPPQVLYTVSNSILSAHGYCISPVLEFYNNLWGLGTE